jgi:hypothetical protein
MKIAIYRNRLVAGASAAGEIHLHEQFLTRQFGAELYALIKSVFANFEGDEKLAARRGRRNDV